MQPEPAAVAWQPVFQRLDVDGVQLRVAVLGDGPPLLLINGIGANVEMWAALATQLPGRRLVMFDCPGTGESPALPHRVRMPALARLVVGLLDNLEIDRADVLGYSWGGALAQELAHQAPQRVRSLVLAATVPGVGGQPPAPWVVAAMATPIRYSSRTYLRLVAPLVFGTSIGADEPHLDARRHRPPSARGYSHQLYAITGWSSRPWLRTLRMPVLVLTGEGDRLAPRRNATILARSIPGARLKVLPGGHLFLLQREQVAGRTITAFLDGQDVSPVGQGATATGRSTT
mgnify:CR=1 FL=1